MDERERLAKIIESEKLTAKQFAAEIGVSAGTISNIPFSEKIWRNDELRFRAVYEVFNNCYAHVDFIYNNARAFSLTSERIEGEDRGWNADGTSRNLSGEELQTYYLNKFTPAYMQGKNFTAVMGLSFGF